MRNTSTNGLHIGLSTQGREISEVNNAISLLGTPSCANSVTLILVTIKNGTPSAKYKVGTHNHGLVFVDFIMQRYNNFIYFANFL